jgi:hypothetical protein
MAKSGNKKSRSARGRDGSSKKHKSREDQEPPESSDSEESQGGGTLLGNNAGNTAVLDEKDALIKKLQGQIGMSKEDKAKHNVALQTLICDTCTQFCWRTTKFLSTTEQCGRFSRKIFNNLAEIGSEFHDTPFPAWQETWGSYCVTALNKTRTYVVQRLRSVAFDYMSDPKRSVDDLPTYDAILECVNRTLNLQTPGKAELWAWYCDELVPRAAGNAEAFGVNLRCFERISTTHLPNQTNSLRVPPSTEAFIGLAFDCYRDVWKEQFSYKQEHGPKKKFPKVRQVKGKIPDDDKKWCTKYTSPDTGSKKLSGWSLEGMQKFAELCDINRKARLTTKSQTLENHALGLLKAIHNIQTDNYEEWLKTKSSKKAKKNVPEPAGIDFVEEE